MESIERAAQNMEFVTSGIREAYSHHAKIERPEGRNLADKAATEYLGECLRLARELQNKLAAIS